MGRIVLVTGGARSGKSSYAEQIAVRRGQRVLYIATATRMDPEMEDRIDRHRAQRPAHWTTVETPLDPGSALREADASTSAVLIDCLVLWSSNHIMSLGDSEAPGWWDSVHELETKLIADLLTWCHLARESPWDLLLVTNEIGLGMVPMSAIGRAYRDMLGRINQAAATASDSVYLLVSGLPINVKRLAEDCAV